MRSSQVKIPGALLMAFAGTFVACNGESTSVVSEESHDAVVSSVSDLPECKSSTEGAVYSVKDEKAFYACYGEDWVKLVRDSEENDDIKVDISCKQESLPNKSGIKIICNGDSVGVVKYPDQEVDECEMEHVGSIVTVTCGESKIKFDVDTFYEKKKNGDSFSSSSLSPSNPSGDVTDVGNSVTSSVPQSSASVIPGEITLPEDDCSLYYTCVNLGLSNCELYDSYTKCSLGPSSSSIVITQGTGLETWHGLYADYRVETGFDDGSETYGYWYRFDDSKETKDNGPGTSKLTWPTEPGNAYSDDALDPIIDACGGFCGSITLGGPYKYPFVGVGFNISGEAQLGNDISRWEGICITYMSTGIAPVIEIVPENDYEVTGGNNLRAQLQMTSVVTTENIAWDAFKQEKGWGTIVDRSSILSNAAVVKIRFEGSGGSTTEFLITEIGAYGRCNGASAVTGGMNR